MTYVWTVCPLGADQVRTTSIGTALPLALNESGGATVGDGDGVSVMLGEGPVAAETGDPSSPPVARATPTAMRATTTIPASSATRRRRDRRGVGATSVGGGGAKGPVDGDGDAGSAGGGVGAGGGGTEPAGGGGVRPGGGASGTDESGRSSG